MKIYNNPNLDKKHCNGVIAIGNFDGLHLGHQKVINEARRKAKKLKLPLGVMTFEPMPVMFFSKKYGMLLPKIGDSDCSVNFVQNWDKFMKLSPSEQKS